jgi:hypothetical protein
MRGNIGSSHCESFEKKGELLSPGSLWVYPAKHPHYAWTRNEEGIFQVQFVGPGGIDYVIPADDPRKKNPLPICANMALCSRCNISFVPFEGTHFGLALRPARCKFVKDRGVGSFGKQSILRIPARPAERECSAGHFP